MLVPSLTNNFLVTNHSNINKDRAKHTEIINNKFFDQYTNIYISHWETMPSRQTNKLKNEEEARKQQYLRIS